MKAVFSQGSGLQCGSCGSSLWSDPHANRVVCVNTDCKEHEVSYQAPFIQLHPFGTEKLPEPAEEEAPSRRVRT
jgi:hypothetical protein